MSPRLPRHLRRQHTPPLAVPPRLRIHVRRRVVVDPATARRFYLRGWRWRLLSDGAPVAAGVAPTWRAALALGAAARDHHHAGVPDQHGAAA